MKKMNICPFRQQEPHRGEPRHIKERQHGSVTDFKFFPPTEDVFFHETEPARQSYMVIIINKGFNAARF